MLTKKRINIKRRKELERYRFPFILPCVRIFIVSYILIQGTELSFPLIPIRTCNILASCFFLVNPMLLPQQGASAKIHWEFSDDPTLCVYNIKCSCVRIKLLLVAGPRHQMLFNGNRSSLFFLLLFYFWAPASQTSVDSLIYSVEDCWIHTAHTHRVTLSSVVLLLYKAKLGRNLG